MQNLEEWQLKIGYFWVQHKKKIKSLFTLFLILLNVGIFSYFGYNLMDYLLGAKEHERMLKEMTEKIAAYEEYRKIHRPIDLEISNLLIVPLGSDRYDFLAQVENLNEKWAVKNLKYRFTFDGGETEYKEGFLLPREKKFFLFLNFYSRTVPKNLNLELKEIGWQRMTKRFLETLPKFTYEDFQIKNLISLPPGSVIRGKPLVRGKTTFQVFNKSPYSFYQTNFKVILYQGKKIVGASSFTIKNFLSNETRKLEVTWPPSITSLTHVLIEPEVNILDPNILMPVR